ncbi:hypothetical protein NDU88_006055 [Pleurodeles waltl]|uniref:Uncharacterized protein n=1 Tax=Pleurodeles waltl TaxID=8319 RepID=A0AAV7UJW6_PLEWA|nr:hypothetical protein NDU88_006055 [Pleurodeles waltl]
MPGEERTRGGVPFLAGAPPACVRAGISSLPPRDQACPPRSAPISIRSRIISVRVGARSNLPLVGRAKGGTASRAQPQQWSGESFIGRGIRATRPTYPLLLLMSKGARPPLFASFFLLTPPPHSRVGPLRSPGELPAPLRAMPSDEPGCTGTTSSALSTLARTRGACGRRHARSPCGRLAAQLKLGSLLSRRLADRLSPSAGRSGTSAPGALGVGGRRWLGYRRS